MFFIAGFYQARIHDEVVITSDVREAFAFTTSREADIEAMNINVYSYCYFPIRVWSDLWARSFVAGTTHNAHIEHRLATQRVDHYADAAPLEYG